MVAHLSKAASFCFQDAGSGLSAAVMICTMQFDALEIVLDGGLANDKLFMAGVPTG